MAMVSSGDGERGEQVWEQTRGGESELAFLARWWVLEMGRARVGREHAWAGPSYRAEQEAWAQSCEQEQTRVPKLEE